MNADIKTTSTTATQSSKPALPPRSRRPAGAIASLPKETRDMINIMLTEGLPPHILMDELGEAGQGLSPQDLADWVQGRYQDYLKSRNAIGRVKAGAEFAADLLRELGQADSDLIYRACSVVAALQMFNAILDYGDEAFQEMLRRDPLNYLGLLNTLVKLSHLHLKREELRLKSGSLPKSTAVELATSTAERNASSPSPPLEERVGERRPSHSQGNSTVRGPQ